MKFRFFILFLPLLAMILPLEGCAQTKKTITLNDFRAEVKALDTDPDLETAHWGLCITDAKTGEVLLGHNESKSLLTASTLKVITSGAALSMLGSDRKFETTLEHDGEVGTEGTLNGNLYLRGGGDVGLGSERYYGKTGLESLFAIWVEKIEEMGIKKINGAVSGDASLFEDAVLPITWQWNDLGNYYAAGANGLCINENTYYLYFKTGKSGEAAELLRTEPEMPGITFVNEITAGPKGSGDNGYIFGAPYTYLRYLRGTIPPNRSEFSIKGSIPDPAWYAAWRLTEKLKSAGIEVSAPPTSVRQQKIEGKFEEKERTPIYTWEGPRIADIVYWLNKRSINLFAEQLVKLCGVEKEGVGSYDAGLEAIRDFWKSKGIDVKGFEMADGSGLSRKNGVTPKQMAQMLAVMSREPAFEAYYDSFPVCGDPDDDGKLGNMCPNTDAAKNMRAKSGYISGVRGYAGYVTTQSGKLITFSMLANNFTCSAYQMKKKFEILMIKLAELE